LAFLPAYNTKKRVFKKEPKKKKKEKKKKKDNIKDVFSMIQITQNPLI
jgi:hypothetical protein